MQTTLSSHEDDFTKVQINTVSQDESLKSFTGTLIKHEIGFNVVFYVLASREVLSNSISGNLEFVLINNGHPVPGQKYYYEINDWPGKWYGHPDQNVGLIIYPFAEIAEKLKDQSIEVATTWVSAEQLLNSDQVLETISGHLGGKWY